VFLLVYTHHRTCFYWSAHTTSCVFGQHPPPHVFILVNTRHLTCFCPTLTTSRVFRWSTPTTSRVSIGLHTPPHVYYWHTHTTSRVSLGLQSTHTTPRVSLGLHIPPHVYLAHNHHFTFQSAHSSLIGPSNPLFPRLSEDISF
jgi:hypothetical protein